MNTGVQAVEGNELADSPEGESGSKDSSETGYRLGLSDFAIVGAIALVVSIAVFVSGWFIFARQAQVKVGVIDLPSIVDIEDLMLTASMMGSHITDDDRSKAYDRVKSFGPQLEAAIEQARTECGCILLTRNAMVGQSRYDMTARVKDMLGMANVNAADLREKISANVQSNQVESKK